MDNIWILVADSSQARIFNAETRSSQLNEMQTFSHPEGRQHEQNLSSDLPGRQADKSSPSHHGLSDRTDLKKHEAIGFSKQIALHLDESRKNQDYNQLIIVAAPSFLGLLREQLSSATSKLITLELDKNLGKESAESIRQHLPEFLPNVSN